MAHFRSKAQAGNSPFWATRWATRPPFPLPRARLGTPRSMLPASGEGRSPIRPRWTDVLPHRLQIRPPETAMRRPALPVMITSASRPPKTGSEIAPFAMMRPGLATTDASIIRNHSGIACPPSFAHPRSSSSTISEDPDGQALTSSCASGSCNTRSDPGLILLPEELPRRRCHRGARCRRPYAVRRSSRPRPRALAAG